MTTITLKAALEQSDLAFIEVIDLTIPLHMVKQDKQTGEIYLYLHRPSTVFFQYGDNSNVDHGRGRRGFRGIRRRDEGRYDVVIPADPNQELKIDPATGRSMVRSMETGGYYPIYFYNKTPKVEFTTPVPEPVNEEFTPDNLGGRGKLSEEDSMVFGALIGGPFPITQPVPLEGKTFSYVETQWFYQLHGALAASNKITVQNLSIERLESGSDVIFQVYIQETMDKGHEYDFLTSEEAVGFLIEKLREL